MGLCLNLLAGLLPGVRRRRRDAVSGGHTARHGAGGAAAFQRAETVFGVLLHALELSGHVVDLELQALDLAGQLRQLLLELRGLQLLLGGEVAAAARDAAGAGAGNLVLQIEHLLLQLLDFGAEIVDLVGAGGARHSDQQTERKAAGYNPAAPAQKPPRGMTHHLIILLLGAAPAARLGPTPGHGPIVDRQ